MQSNATKKVLLLIMRCRPSIFFLDMTIYFIVNLVKLTTVIILVTHVTTFCIREN